MQTSNTWGFLFRQAFMGQIQLVAGIRVSVPPFSLHISKDQLHEDGAALRIARAICWSNLAWSEPAEGKSNITTRQNGLLKVNIRGLTRINTLGDIVVSTLKTNFPCKRGQLIAATRIIPLVIQKKKIAEMGHGGLCMNCVECRFPDCSFGK